MSPSAYKEVFYATANDLWDDLSQTKSLFGEPSQNIYRGQADSQWTLIPSLLRNEDTNPNLKFFGKRCTSEQLIFKELHILEEFVKYCDDIGVKIPNDSIEFRDKVLDSQHQDRFYKDPNLWPNEKLIELMALAQHHGVPTRLLDWTKRPYVAVYFAVSSAMANYKTWNAETKIAIWVLNITSPYTQPNIKIKKVPGSISHHLSAQSGVFTIHPHSSVRKGEFITSGLEQEFLSIPNPPLLKLVLPVSEVLNLYKLCEKSCINGATIYPSADGAGKAVQDGIHASSINRLLVNGQLFPT